MNSLDVGKSPTINVRVPLLRKRQLQAIAEHRGVLLSTLVQEVIDGFIMETEGREREVATQAMKEAMREAPVREG